MPDLIETAEDKIERLEVELFLLQNEVEQLEERLKEANAENRQLSFRLARSEGYFNK